MNIFGLIIWILDDGNFNYRQKSINLSTLGFSYSMLVYFKEKFIQRWGLNPKIMYVKLDKDILEKTKKFTNQQDLKDEGVTYRQALVLSRIEDKKEQKEILKVTQKSDDNVKKIRKKDKSENAYLKKCGFNLLRLSENEILNGNYEGKILKCL